MSQITIYHNPRCSKSRQTLQLLNDQGLDPQIVLYLEDAPDLATLRNLSKYLKLRPQEWVRKNEEAFKNAGVDLEDDEALFQLMAIHPKVMERPIVVKGKRAVIGRPPENVLALLKSAVR